ncbi:hypothetical protein M9Y10_012608 [Tritrichomonas musculus]|uniref:PPPDE domain-containing protein n=1 Tax=Tritrichomonas musculus TaxID=1915356 RepID=A0ABR2ID36_9EUKA
MRIKSGSCVDSLYNYGSLTPRYQKIKPIKSDRSQLLSAKISDIVVFVQRLDDKEFEFNAKNIITGFLPARINPTNATHAGIIANTTNGMHVLIEYGAYDYHREGDYDFQVHYYKGRDGLRFVKLTDSFYEFIHDESYRYLVFDCTVRNKMAINTMIDKTKWVGKYHSWDKDSYNPVGENCQLFVRKCIQVLDAVRTDEEDRNRTLSKTCFPFRIIDALEKNENDTERKIEKIPIIGTVFGMVKAFT